MTTYHFRKATESDTSTIWGILQYAIQLRKKDGSSQWQDGYPNPNIVQNDIEKGAGFVMTDGKAIVGYCSVLINDEPQYATIEGSWLSNSDFVVFHRVAISESYVGKGLSKKMLQYIEEFALTNNIYSIKADTNYDNIAMLKIFEKAGYVYCGEVYFRGTPRKAFEKTLTK